MINYPNGDQIESSSDLALIKFLEQCWQLEAAERAEATSEINANLSSTSLIEIDETRQGYPALSQFMIALWMPLIWLCL